MSSINLFLLGFIKRKPTSAYDLAQFIEKNHLKKMIKISSPAVYKNLIILNEKGLLKSSDFKTENNKSKTIYSITPKGNEYFKILMENFSQKKFDIYFDFNSFVVGLDLIEKNEALDGLTNFKKVLLKKEEEYKEILKTSENIPFSGQEILKQFLKVNRVLIDWTEKFSSEYMQNK